MNRRHFLQASLSLAGTGLALTGLAAQEARVDQRNLISNGGEGPQTHLTFYPDTENGRHQLHQLWVSQGNHVLLSYRAHQTQKYPFFSPMSGPVSGLPLVTETGRPWPHHRGVFFGLDRIHCENHSDYNFWQGPLSSGQIVSQGPSFARNATQHLISPTSGEIGDPPRPFR